MDCAAPQCQTRLSWDDVGHTSRARDEGFQILRRGTSFIVERLFGLGKSDVSFE
jgi:hypothetical protein